VNFPFKSNDANILIFAGGSTKGELTPAKENQQID